ncbi:MAG: putative Ig domain-containing protein, partial [Pseudomonadota bacterium]
VQGLAEDQKVIDRFAYTASDGTAATTGELAVTVSGDNDAPVLARCLADVQLAKGKAFSWQIPAGSFKDIDHTDTLTYTARLANGKPLPSWLKFDAATQTFSGTAPAGNAATIDVKVLASDGHGACSTASDVFRISIGNKTVLPAAAKGNEGVGNGADAPPPGHAVNQNDGAGTSPGNPGRNSKGAGQDLLDRFLDGFKADAKATNKNPLGALDAGWFERWLSPPAPSSGQAMSSGNGQAVEAHWQHLLRALNRLDAERQGASQWPGKSQGADLSGLAGLLSGNAAMLRTHGDAVGLAAAGTELKGFAGLREGVTTLRC